MVAFIRYPVPWAGFATNLLVWPFLFECLILWNVLALSLLWMAATWVLSKLILAMAFLLDRALSQEKGVLAGGSALPDNRRWYKTPEIGHRKSDSVSALWWTKDEYDTLRGQ
jgi:hypothetical protein